MQDRRRGPDALTKWVSYAGIISWILIAAALFITFIAKPGFESYMDDSFHIKLQEDWNEILMHYAFVLLVLLFFFCMVSILINLMRYRRKSDRLNKTLILNAAASLTGIILYLLFFI
ncbi:MAG TPA: hypothetical protein VN580_11420 [Clostridia bacterium]|nr:hypothetical protein [Clostridia bacterium]